MNLHPISDRKYLEARRFLHPVSLLDPFPLLNHLGLRMKKEPSGRVSVSSSDKLWTLRDGMFYRRPARKYPDFITCDDLVSFSARFCGSASKGLDALREAYRETSMFAESLYTDQLASLCTQFLTNKLVVENIIRRGQKRALDNRHYDPGWYQVEIDNQFPASMSALAFSSVVAALSVNELKTLGCGASQLLNIRYPDDTIPVFFYCSDPATVSEICFPVTTYRNKSDWFFRCGKSGSSTPAYAPFAFAGLRALVFDDAPELKIYCQPSEFCTGVAVTGADLFPLLVGAGRSLEQVFTPLQSRKAHAYVGASNIQHVLRLASFFRNLNIYSEDLTQHCPGEERYDSVLSSVRVDWYVGNTVRRMYDRDAASLPGALEVMAPIDFGPERARRITDMLELEPEEDRKVFNSLCSGGSVEETDVALDGKHTLSADPYTSTVVDADGFSHLVYNFKVFFEQAILFGDGGSADHYTLRILFLDKEGDAKEVRTIAGRRVATSWRELASCIKYACERDSIDFEPAAEDITYSTVLHKHWLTTINKAPFIRGNNFLGFSPLPGGGFLFPGVRVRPPDCLFTSWTPHPADAALSHFTGPECNLGQNDNLPQRPGFRMLLGYCVAACARYMLGQELKPLVIRDSAEARLICGNFFKGFGQVGPLFIRQTDGAGVYKKIFSNLMGYPMWCLGPSKPVVKPMRGPVIVLDSEADQELAPDPELQKPDVASTAFHLFTTWLLHFMEDPEEAISKLQPHDPCTSAEGAVLLAYAMPVSGWESLEDFYPLTLEALMDIPEEVFPTLLTSKGSGVVFTPTKWSVGKGRVKAELNANGIAVKFHGSASLLFPKGDADRFKNVAKEFYATQTLPVDHDE